MRERIENVFMYAVAALAVIYLARIVGCVFSISGGFANYALPMVQR